MSGIIICGTDTGVGKTVVTGLLARYLLERGFKAATQKWIQTGTENMGLSDNDYHYQITRELRSQQRDSKFLPYINPYRFTFPASPHLASRLEGKIISVRKIIKCFKTLEKNFDFVIVEGTGGLLVPIDEKILIADVVKKLDLLVVIVSENKLGTINHTLLTIEALRKRNLKVLGIIFNSASKNENEIILEDNPKIVKKISGCEILGILPFKKNVPRLYDEFRLIGDMIFDKMTSVIAPSQR